MFELTVDTDSRLYVFPYLAGNQLTRLCFSRIVNEARKPLRLPNIGRGRPIWLCSAASADVPLTQYQEPEPTVSGGIFPWGNPSTFSILANEDLFASSKSFIRKYVSSPHVVKGSRSMNHANNPY